MKPRLRAWLASVRANADPEITFRRWWWLPLAWVLAGVLFSLQPFWWGGFPWASTLQIEIYRWWPWLILAPLIVWLALRLPLVGRHWLLALVVHLAASLLVVAAVDRVVRPGFGGPGRVGPVFYRLEPGENPRPERPRPPEVENRLTREAGPMGRGFPGPRPPFFALRLRLTLPLYWSLVGLAHLLLFNARARRTARMETQLLEARLTALQMQLQPHFLFNSLNAISSLVHARPEAADEMICALAALLRAALTTQGSREIPLHEELKLAQHYIRIQRVRFGSEFDIVEEIAAEVRQAAVPPLILQPLLENAVTHGLGNRAGTLALRAFARDGRLHLAVEDFPAQDDTPRPTPSPGTGIGLSNTRARLAALYGNAASVSLEDRGGSRVTEVRLPLRRTTS